MKFSQRKQFNPNNNPTLTKRFDIIQRLGFTQCSTYQFRFKNLFRGCYLRQLQNYTDAQFDNYIKWCAVEFFDKFEKITIDSITYAVLPNPNKYLFHFDKVIFDGKICVVSGVRGKFCVLDCNYENYIAISKIFKIII